MSYSYVSGAQSADAQFIIFERSFVDNDIVYMSQIQIVYYILAILSVMPSKNSRRTPDRE